MNFVGDAVNFYICAYRNSWAPGVSLQSLITYLPLVLASVISVVLLRRGGTASTRFPSPEASATTRTEISAGRNHGRRLTACPSVLSRNSPKLWPFARRGAVVETRIVTVTGFRKSVLPFPFHRWSLWLSKARISTPLCETFAVPTSKSIKAVAMRWWIYVCWALPVAVVIGPEWWH